MDTNIIRKLLKSFKCFKGVYPLDLLPYSKDIPLTIIINTDPHNEPGEHWVAISIDETGRGYYFDSFGNYPLKKEIFDFLEDKCIEGWTYNKVQLQYIFSTTCGNYCVLYVIFRCQGLSNEYFISKFRDDPLKNDKKMIEIFGDFSLANSFS